MELKTELSKVEVSDRKELLKVYSQTLEWDVKLKTAIKLAKINFLKMKLLGKNFLGKKDARFAEY